MRRVEPFRAVPVRFRHGHLEREAAITGIDPETRLRRIVDATGQIQPLPMEGLVLSGALANALSLSAGEVVQVDLNGGIHLGAVGAPEE